MTGRRPHLVGLAVTAVLHGALVVLVLATQGDDGCGGGAADASTSSFDDAITIEASLAFQEVKPQSRQPVKQRKEMFRPTDDAPTIIDPTAPERPPQPDQKLKPKPEEIDVDSILEKNRAQDEDLSTTGVDEVPVEGSATGSKWGTERDAKGDPYAAELKGRIYSVWKVPSLETGSGEAHGCVKLDAAGKITNRQLKKKSGNANLDRSVELALDQAPDMDTPLPDDPALVELLTKKGICFRFTLEGT